MNSDGEYCGQISSAQSADIVLTAGQDIVHRRRPGRLFPNDWEVKRFLPFRKRYPAAPDDIHACGVDDIAAMPRRYPPGGRTSGGATEKRGCKYDATLAPMRASALPVHHWLARIPCPCVSATPPAGGVPGLLLRYTQGSGLRVSRCSLATPSQAAADAAPPWASVLTAPPVGGAQNSARLRLAKVQFVVESKQYSLIAGAIIVPEAPYSDRIPRQGCRNRRVRFPAHAFLPPRRLAGFRVFCFGIPRVRGFASRVARLLRPRRPRLSPLYPGLVYLPPRR